jgi:predicted extracellular nuclease
MFFREYFLLDIIKVTNMITLEVVYMKGILLALLVCGLFALNAITIYDIQYTSFSGTDNTYPSRFVGKDVTVSGIVTAVNYRNGGFFICEPAGGPWRGIYIKANTLNINTGDKVILKGIVDEYFGMTCIRDLQSVTLRDTNQPVPFPNQVTTGQITTPDQAEAYEGTLVRVQNATFVQGRGSAERFTVNDGSGQCFVYDNFTAELNHKFKSGDVFSSLTGIVGYSYGEYSVNPRLASDMAVMVPVFNQNRSWGRIKSIYK